MRKMKPSVAQTLTALAVLALACLGLAFNTGTGTYSAFGLGEFNLLCPLGGLEALLASKVFVPQALVSLVVVAVLALAFGRAWCAWACPTRLVRRVLGKAAAEEKLPANPCAGAFAQAVRSDTRVWVLVIVLAAALAGAGTGIVALRGCLAMGELSARNSFIVSGATLLQAFVIYLAILALPLEAGMALLVLLPFMAGVHLCFHRNGEQLPAYREDAHQTRAPLWRMTVALFILAIVFSLSRGMYPSGLDISDFNDTRNFAALGSMAFCMAMLLLSLVLPQGTSFGKLGYWMVVAIIFLTALFPVLGLGSSASGIASTIANSALGVTAWALFGAMASLSRISPLRVYGLGFSAFMLGSAVGWPIGFVVNIEALGVTQYYVGFGLLVIVFLVVLTLFRQSDLAKMTSEPELEVEVGKAAEPVDDGNVEPGAADGAGSRNSSEADEASAPAAVDDASPESTRPKNWKGRMRLVAQEHLLTERETEVFLLMAKGLNARTISDALGFSYNTARVHVRNIYTKLDVHSRDELLAFVTEQDRLQRS